MGSRLRLLYSGSTSSTLSGYQACVDTLVHGSCDNEGRPGRLSEAGSVSTRGQALHWMGLTHGCHQDHHQHRQALDRALIPSVLLWDDEDAHSCCHTNPGSVDGGGQEVRHIQQNA